MLPAAIPRALLRWLPDKARRTMLKLVAVILAALLALRRRLA